MLFMLISFVFIVELKKAALLVQMCNYEKKICLLFFEAFNIFIYSQITINKYVHAQNRVFLNSKFD